MPSFVPVSAVQVTGARGGGREQDIIRNVLAHAGENGCRVVAAFIGTVFAHSAPRLPALSGARACPGEGRRYLLPTSFPNCRIYGSGGGIALVMPSMDDRIAVGVVDKFRDPLLQFTL
jgi:hypothetical protein